MPSCFGKDCPGDLVDGVNKGLKERFVTELATELEAEYHNQGKSAT